MLRSGVTVHMRLMLLHSSHACAMAAEHKCPILQCKGKNTRLCPTTPSCLSDPMYNVEVCCSYKLEPTLLLTVDKAPGGSGASSTIPTAARTASISENHSSLTRLASLQACDYNVSWQMRGCGASLTSTTRAYHLYLRKILAASSSEMPRMDVTLSMASFCLLCISAFVSTMYLFWAIHKQVSMGRASAVHLLLLSSLAYLALLCKRICCSIKPIVIIIVIGCH